MARVSLIFALIMTMVGDAIANGPAEPTEAAALEVGPATTVVEGPLRDDGTIDYTAALNTQRGEGVVPENNLAVVIAGLMARKVWPSDEHRARTFKKLEAEVPEDEASFFMTFDQFAQARANETSEPSGSVSDTPDEQDTQDYRELLEGRDRQPWRREWERAQAGPWTEADAPLVAEWLATQEDALDRLAEAAKQREQYWMPLVAMDDDDMIVAVLMPWLGEIRQLIHSVQVRAHRRIADEKVDETIKDALTIQRVNRHMANESMLIGQLVAISLAITATDVVSELAASEDLTTEQARNLLDQLKALEHGWNMKDAIGRDDRFATLDVLQRPWGIARVGLGVVPPDQALAAFDRNRAMRRANEIYDGLVVKLFPHKAADQPNATEIREAYTRFQERMEQLPDQRNWDMLEELVQERAEQVGLEAAMTDMITDLIISVVLPAYDHALTTARHGKMSQTLGHVAVALAGYRVETGQYPQTLEELVVSGWLDAVPEDRFSEAGEQVRYRLEDDEVAVYSVGRNGLDDGGRLDGDDREDLVVGWKWE